MEQTIANALDILQSKKLSYAAKRERIRGCFNVSGFKELIEWYENEASTVPRNEAPLIKNLENQDLNNLYKLVHIRPLIQELKYLEVESLFIKNLLAFMPDKVNADIWNEVSHEVISIIKELHTSSKEILRKELREAKRSLCLSSFDRQVRALIYNRDMAKKSIIDEIEENL